MAAERLKVNAGVIDEYCKNRREREKPGGEKKPVVSIDDLEIYQRAVAADKKILKRIEEASGHSYASKAGWKAAKEELDGAFAVIVKAIRDRRDISIRGHLDRRDESGSPIDCEWFDDHPELKTIYEMNALGYETWIDVDGSELPKLETWRINVKLDWDEIEKLRGETSAWPHKRGGHAVTDEPSPAPDSKGGTTAPPPKKRGGGLKRGPYYGRLKKHLKWRKDQKDDLDTASLKEIREDARRRLTTDRVKGIPKTRSGLEEAIKAALRDLGVNR